MAPFVPKSWKNRPNTSTPISAAALVDMEERLAKYAEESGGGSAITKEFVDFNNFHNVGGEQKGVTAAEATEIIEGHKRDCAGTIQEALLKAAVTGGSVSCSEPGTYFLESTRISTNPKAYPKLKAGYEAATFNACLHKPANVVLGAPQDNAAAMKLEVGPRVWQTCITERESNANYACVAIGAESTVTIEQVNFTPFTLGCSAPLSPYLKSKIPPPLPDGIYASASGRYVGVVMGNAGFRYGLVQGANHMQIEKLGGGGWAKMAWPNYAASAPGATGNTELLWCSLSGGYTAAYVESECSIGGIRMYGGWLGYGTQGPIFYKPTTVKKNFINGLHLIGCQFELGRGPLFYNEDGLGNIAKVTTEMIQAGGADPPMGNPGANGDITIGYRPELEAPMYGAAVDAYIKAGRITEINASEQLIPEVGWGSEAAAVIGTIEVAKCNFGDVTAALERCRYRSLPFVRSPIQSEISGTFLNRQGLASTIGVAWANTEVKQGELLRAASSNESKADQAVEPFNKKEGVVAGQAFLTAAAKNYVTYVRKNSTRPTNLRLPVANLGYAEGEQGSIPPLVRGGKLKLAAAMENGSGTGATHAAVQAVYGINSFKGGIFTTGLADLPASGTMSFGGKGTIFTYRQKIARGTKTEPKAKITNGSKELTSVKVEGVSSIKGLAPGMFITGTGIPKNTQIEVVDEENFRLQLTNPATKTEEQTLTVEAATDILEGTLFGSSSRCTSAINLALMTGTGTIKVVSTEGWESAGSVRLQVAPYASAQPTTYTIEYTSKSSTDIKGCTVTKVTSNVAAIGTILTPLGIPKIEAHARIQRVAQIVPPTPASSVYEGTERQIKAEPIEFEVESSTAFSTAARGLVETKTTLPAEVTLEKTTKKIKVVDAKAFPEKSPKGEAGEKIGKLEIGTKVVADLIAVDYTHNELEVEFTKLSNSNKTQPAGQTVKLQAIEVVWTGKATKKLTGFEAVTGGSTVHRVHKGAVVTQLVVSTGGGVLEGENVASEIQKMGYQGQATAKGKTYLYGVRTPGGGGEIASGKELTDLTVLPVEGSGFPTGPAAAISKGGSQNITFSYTEFVNVTGEEEGNASEESGEGEGGEEGGEGEEVEIISAAGLARGFFVGVSNVFVNGSEGSAGSAGTYTGATKVTTEVKTSETVTSVKVTSTAGYPSTGVLLLLKDEVTYTAIASSTVFTVSSYKPTANITVGTAVPLAPGKQVKADDTVRAAFGGSGHEGEGDKGVVRVGGEGEHVGAAIAADESGSVLVQF